MGKISNFRDLHIYQNALEAAMDIFEITKSFPKEERFSIVDQIRRSSRSVCANIAEAWRKRRYRAAFIAKLNDAETEACETQIHLEISSRCNYLPRLVAHDLDRRYEIIMAQILRMIQEPEKWLVNPRR